MREIDSKTLYQAVSELCRDANTELNSDILDALKESAARERNGLAQDILRTILTNAALASEQSKPLCQDTGIGVFFIEIGDNVKIRGGNLTEIVGSAMSELYLSYPFRLSVVQDPYFNRTNTNNNLPAIIHTEIVAGDSLKITFLPKGGGAENMSRIKMFNPLSGINDVKDFVVETVALAGGKPCPPVIVGVGIGGSFDYAALLAKKALLRPLTTANEDENWAATEKEILHSINLLGIGPMGLGGDTTALGVNILTYPCHIASLPVAVNLQCHSHRHKTVIL